MDFRAGQPIHRSLSASLMNGLAEMHRQWQTNGRSIGGGRVTIPHYDTTAWIKNATGGELRTGEIVEISDTLIANDMLFEGDTPDETRQFGIVLQPLLNERVGKIQIAGACPALINVQATTDLWAFVESGQDVLKGDRFWGDVRLLETPEETGEQLLWVKIEASPQEWYGIADEEIVQDDTGAVSIFTGADFTTDTTHSIPDCFNFTGLTVDSGARCVVKRISRKKAVEPLECPA